MKNSWQNDSNRLLEVNWNNRKWREWDAWTWDFWGGIVPGLDKAVAPDSGTLAWKTPWMVEPGRLQSMGSWRVGQTERLHFHFSLSCIEEGNGNLLQYWDSCLENPRERGAWWAAIYGIARSQTRLMWLSSSSSSIECRYPYSFPNFKGNLSSVFTVHPSHGFLLVWSH